MRKIPTGVEVLVLDAPPGRLRVGQDDFGGRSFEFVAGQDVSDGTAAGRTAGADRGRRVQGHVEGGPAVVGRQRVRARVAAVQHHSRAHSSNRVEQQQSFHSLQFSDNFTIAKFPLALRVSHNSRSRNRRFSGNRSAHFGGLLLAKGAP
jgi:hypothetical protein